MKKVVKVVSLLVILVSILSATVLAADTGSGISPANFTGNSSFDTNSIKGLGNQVITIVSTVGTIGAVVVLVVLGLKYMMGSAEEKAEYKKTLLPYIIGAALVFAASSIAGIIFNFAKGIG